ncbi:MAG: MlaD family protein [Burkholderiaceae bacterium]
MENKAHAMAAGLFVLVVLGLLGGLAAWLTRDQGSYESFELMTPQTVTGLQPKASVRYKGVTVGSVESIGFDPAEPGQVLIRIRVDRNAPLSRRTFATLGYQGVTGLAYVDLDDADEPLPDLGLTSRGYRRLAMRQSNLSQIAALGPEVIGDVRDAMARLNRLLADDNQQVLFGAIARLGEAAQNTAVLVGGMEQRWTNELAPLVDRLGRDGSDSLQAMQRAADGMAAMSREIAGLSRRLGEQNGPIERLTDSARSVAGVVGEVDRVTMPRLRRTLDEIDDAMRSVSALARELSANPQSLLYGPAASQPGPGEPGYVAPPRPEAGR